MMCPLCKEEMLKDVTIVKTVVNGKEENTVVPWVHPRNNHHSMKCPRCSFVIFYKGVVGISSDLI